MLKKSGNESMTDIEIIDNPKESEDPDTLLQLRSPYFDLPEEIRHSDIGNAILLRGGIW